MCQLQLVQLLCQATVLVLLTSLASSAVLRVSEHLTVLRSRNFSASQQMNVNACSAQCHKPQRKCKHERECEHEHEQPQHKRM